MQTYDIEMWRYARELKRKSPNPDLSFDHVHSKSAIVQNVAINLNEMGLRGGPLRRLPDGGRRILFLGGSITLGWGVAEAQTVEAQLEAMLHAVGEDAEVLNGGVGNYNTVRYISRFFNELTSLNPTDIVVQYFLRDAQDLPPDSGNFILRNSQLAVTLWIAYHRMLDKVGEKSLVEHYRAIYQSDAAGFIRMQAELRRLSEYAKAHGIRIYMAMTPDIHNLVDYKLASSTK
jgi:hypothetical protein